ncbi:MAG: hypothetical protein WC823_02680 [Parcubacteria group bacterium]|jgi:hypothetical protein
MENTRNHKNKPLSEVDIFLVQTFKGLIEFVLAILGFVLIIVLPFVFFAMGGASILSGKWLMGCMYLLLIIVSFYSARGLTELLNNNEK